jgi:hypothetical protein
MDFVRYAERSAGLVNADLGDAGHLIHFLDERAWLHAAVEERDAVALRRFASTCTSPTGSRRCPSC